VHRPSAAPRRGGVTQIGDLIRPARIGAHESRNFRPQGVNLFLLRRHLRLQLAIGLDQLPPFLRRRRLRG
jgi:hypothetical protein